MKHYEIFESNMCFKVKHEAHVKQDHQQDDKSPIKRQMYKKMTENKWPSQSTVVKGELE